MPVPKGHKMPRFDCPVCGRSLVATSLAARHMAQRHGWGMDKVMRLMDNERRLAAMAQRMYADPVGRGLDECSGDPNGPYPAARSRDVPAPTNDPNKDDGA